MNKYQEQGYKNDAEKIKNEMRKEGYLSLDIVAVAFFLLKANIEDAERLHAKDNEIADLLSRAEKLTNDI